MNTKSFLTSKTFWFNFLTVVVEVATAYGYTPDKALTDNVAQILIVASPVINIILRFWTNKAVTILG